MKCANCGRPIAEDANSVRLELYGGRAAFHFAYFAGSLLPGAADELERRAWRESTTAQPAAPAPVKARGEKYEDEPK